MTIIYFVRHAESDFRVLDDEERPLTKKGLSDALRVSDFLENKLIDIIISSPYKRAVDTITDFADRAGKEIILNCGFRERKVDTFWIEDFKQFSKNQWEDFEYKLNDGECLREVQNRNINALNEVLDDYDGKNIVIGSHGTALSTIINFFDKSFGYEDFDEIRSLMPWIVKFTFEGRRCIEIKKINVFTEI